MTQATTIVPVSVGNLEQSIDGGQEARTESLIARRIDGGEDDRSWRRIDQHRRQAR